MSDSVYFLGAKFAQASTFATDICMFFLLFFFPLRSLKSCRVILGFVLEVPICAAAAAVMNVFQSEEQIRYDGKMRRAGALTKMLFFKITTKHNCSCVKQILCVFLLTAICGNVGVSNNPLEGQVTWTESVFEPANFCTEVKETNIRHSWFV